MTDAPTTKIDYGRAFNRLTHVIALSRTGKVEAVIRDLVITILVIDDSLASQPATAICRAVDDYFGVDLGEDDVEDALGELARGGKLVIDPQSGQRAVQPHEKSAVLDRVAAASELEARVKTEWLAALTAGGIADGLDREALWRCLRTYLAKVLARHGAESILLLDPHAPMSGSQMSLASLQTSTLRDCGLDADAEGARPAITSFFTAPTADRTRYLAQLLDGTFTFFALSADSATEEYLSRSLPSLSIFLDTNFIFGLLALHENPLDAVSRELVDYIGSQRFPFKLYYHERTLDEIRRTLNYLGERLTRVRWTPSLSRAAVRAGTLSSLELRFHELNAKSHIDAEVFLERYERHISELLESLGFKIYREAEGGPTVEERGRLTAEYAAYLKEARKPEKAYPTIDHDMSVWLSLQRLRTRGRSVLESGAVFLSNDFLLYRFDRFHLTKKAGIQTVVMPGPLLQVLRPFGRASDDFDRRFVATFAIPEFRTVHSDYAATTSRVLSYMATYADLPEELAVKMLTNEVLIDRLQRVDSRSPEFREVIESEMVRQNAALEAELGRLRVERDRETADHATRLASANAEAEAARGAVAALKAEREIDQPQPAKTPQVEESAVLPARSSDQRDAQAEIATLRHRVGLIAAGAITLVGLLLVLAVPEAVRWQWLLEHENRLNLQAGGLVIVGGLAWAAADEERRWLAAAAVVIGMILGVIPLL
jgi:hypothetical protein